MYVCNYVYIVLTHICTTKVIFCNWSTIEDIIIIIIIPGDRNVIKKEAEKILKYNDLTIEIHSMWNVKTRVIAVIIGTTGTISKSFRKYVSDIPGNHDVNELQKTAILGTAHLLRGVLT
jgi:hypothetical protein